MRSETQPYSTVLQYGCVALRMRLFSQNFGTIKQILPGSSSPSHHEGPGTEVDHQLTKQYHQLCAAVLYVATSFFASEFKNILVGTVSETAGLVIGQTRIGRLWLLERDLAGRWLLHDQGRNGWGSGVGGRLHPRGRLFTRHSTSANTVDISFQDGIC